MRNAKMMRAIPAVANAPIKARLELVGSFFSSNSERTCSSVEHTCMGKDICGTSMQKSTPHERAW